MSQLNLRVLVIGGGRCTGIPAERESRALTWVGFFLVPQEGRLHCRNMRGVPSPCIFRHGTLTGRCVLKNRVCLAFAVKGEVT
jgi:hypothetical protein